MSGTHTFLIYATQENNQGNREVLKDCIRVYIFNISEDSIVFLIGMFDDEIF